MINESKVNKIQEMTRIMLHYSNGGEVLSRPLSCNDEEFELDLSPVWNWGRYEYKIAPQKKVIYAIFRGDELLSASVDKAIVSRNSSNYNLPMTVLKEV
jgi:hypothetical protein